MVSRQQAVKLQRQHGDIQGCVRAVMLQVSLAFRDQPRRSSWRRTGRLPVPASRPLQPPDLDR
jgi:hypothetical protein